MPYFKWYAIDLAGNEYSGISSATSFEQLSKKLLRENKGLMKAHEQPLGRFGRQPSLMHIEQFIQRLAATVAAGLSVDEAFTTFIRTETHSLMQKMLADLGEQLHEGVSLSQAFNSYPLLFDPIVRAVARVGERSGNLTDALHKINAYLKAQRGLRVRLRAVLIPALLTAAFLGAVILVVVIFIAPTFATFFAALQAPVPSVLTFLLALRSFLLSLYVWSFTFIAIGAFSFIPWISFCTVAQRILIKVPIVGSLYRHAAIAELLRSIALMVESEVPLREAVILVRSTASFWYTRHVATNLLGALEQGNSFFKASELYFQHAPHVHALIRAGELSGQFVQLMHAAVELHDHELIQRCENLIAIMQPVIICFFGAAIAGLLLSLYVPIISLSGALY